MIYLNFHLNFFYQGSATEAPLYMYPFFQGSACEVMMFRTARRYDVKSDTIVFADGSPYTKENMRMGGLDDYVDDMFDFCRGMGLMEVDNSEYALLTAISIFSGEW